MTTETGPQKAALCVALACMGVLLASGTASAAFTYSLDTGNSAISGYTGPYGTVAVTRDDNQHATIIATALNNGGYNYLFGDGGTLGLNTNGAVSIVGSNAGITGAGPNQGIATGYAAGDLFRDAAGNE